jgi:phosphatidate cytidylyltransferase
MGDWTPPEQRFSELPLRLLTASILIPFALFAVWNGSWWLAAGCGVFCAAMMLEWCRMSAAPNENVLAALGFAFGLSLASGFEWVSAAILACGVALASAAGYRALEGRFTGALGVIYIFGMVAGLYVLREGPWDGRGAALYFMSIVWASDASAYFFGRLIRGPRLLPRESPNKTWSGAVSAIIMCGLCGVIAANGLGGSQQAWITAGILISVIAQAGDLFESGLKRRFKVKDSGSLLPGHGGLLDRVDGLGAVGIVSVAVFLGVPGLPGLLGL